MLGSDAYVGYVSGTGSNATGFIQSYYLKKKNLDASGLIQNRLFGFTAGSASLVNGILTLSLTRPLDQGQNPIVADKNGYYRAILIASYSSYIGLPNAKHSHRSDHGVYVDFGTGQSATVYRYPTPTRVAHGVLMGVAYAIVFPLGLMIARYGKGRADWWFKGHFFLQNYGLILMIIGVCIGYTLPALQYNSFTYHAILGTIIWVLTLVQVVMGYLRPHKEPGEDITPQRMVFEFFHHWLGRSILILAIVQIIAGIRELEVANWAYGIWVPFLGTFFILSIIMEVKLATQLEKPLDIHRAL